MKHAHWLVLVVLLVSAACRPGQAQSDVSCASTVRVEVAPSDLAVDRAKLSKAACLVVQGGLAQGAAARLPNPLTVRVVADLHGEKMNAQFLTPGLLNFESGHVEVTRDLVAGYSDNALAFVLAHEIAHRLNMNGASIHVLMALRNVLCAAAVLAPVIVLSRHRRRARRWLQVAAWSAGAVMGLLAWTLSTVGLAAMSIHFAYAADRRGIDILVAAGWPRERAASAFRAFLSVNGGRAADSWLSENRHPLDADRARAALPQMRVMQATR